VNDIRGRLGLRQSQVFPAPWSPQSGRLVEASRWRSSDSTDYARQPVKQLHKWLDRYRCICEERFEQLDELVEEIKQRKNRMLLARTGEGTCENETTVKRRPTVSWSSRAVFNGPAHIVFDA